jgi:integrase
LAKIGSIGRAGEQPPLNDPNQTSSHLKAKIRRLRWFAGVDRSFEFRQQKKRNRHGGREMFIPIVDKLSQALDRLDRSKGGAVLKNAYGRPFAEKSLTGMMAHWNKQAGIPAGYTLHGLRRTFGTHLAECNARRAPSWRRWAFLDDGD